MSKRKGRKGGREFSELFYHLFSLIIECSQPINKQLLSHQLRYPREEPFDAFIMLTLYCLSWCQLRKARNKLGKLGKILQIDFLELQMLSKEERVRRTGSIQRKIRSQRLTWVFRKRLGVRSVKFYKNVTEISLQFLQEIPITL